ncbi:MAG: FMN-binding glutamate synthase family protein [Gammaproteobacteria bacterium]|nr:FMN-binding glutamate synthase family protein [Gammaproteobacteria bacterium]
MQSGFSKALLLAIALSVFIVPFWPDLLWGWLIFSPLILLGFYDRLQSKHSLRRNFPLFGRARWLMESIRPFIRQYFIESDTDGTPINRMFRSIVYQRAKGVMETVPFGTKVDVYRSGYEWIGHSLSALNHEQVEADLRVTIGGSQCQQPYSASILNISAMSFGALSQNAILALNHGAKMGGFFHNTGEGGISPYHLEHGGDLVWQIGTAYFGCRDAEGRFCAETFRQQAALNVVKMIEIKLSQGAKPGHGGILPAEKNSAEIAQIRGVEPYADVNSPATHSRFDSPYGLLEFVAQLRELSAGKPIGFKLSIGRKSEFIAICKAMQESSIRPDFITVDGGEGGTGAAPMEYSNSIGMPLREALAFVVDALMGFGLKAEIKVIASGKIISGFHLVKNMALGADLCNSARGMMLALGCVQSLVCNSNHCPSGVATQDPKLVKGLVVSDKAMRVKNFHERTVQAVAEMIASAGLHHPSELNRTDIYRRVTQFEVRRYDQIFPYLNSGSLLSPDLSDDLLGEFVLLLQEACSDGFSPHHCLTQIDNECCHVETEASVGDKV